ncbi:MAG TPA: ABC transporter permease [Woeseiaceae bacterium]|nr:ABC transporter permease [Woeseiaceae bacterium]
MKLTTNIGQDIRYAVRQLAKNPGFTLVAVVTLALGIGANTAIFSVVDGVLLRPAPFAETERLMMVWETDRNSGTTREPASLPDYLDFRDRSETFETMAGFAAGDVNLTHAGGEPLRLPAVSSTHELLPMLGIEPIIGRTFTAEETAPGGGHVVLISERLWERLYRRDTGVLGGTVRLDGVAYSIVGVVPDSADFGMLQILGAAAYSRGFADRGGRQQVGVWMPLQQSTEEWSRDTHPMFVAGRLTRGAGPDAAQLELAAIAAELERLYPENDARGVNVEPFDTVIFGDVRPALLVLLCAVGLVLLVACANVANLLLARSSGRAREVAVRAALGAGGGRLARQFLVEGVLLALVGGAAGVVLAVLGTELLLGFAPGDIPRLETVGVDWRPLGVALAISLVVGVAFGLVPTLQARRADLTGGLQSEAGGTKSSGRGLLRSALVVAELAGAVVLLVGAVLLMKSFWQILAVDPGFRAEQVLKAEFQLPESRYPADFATWPNFREMHRFNAALLERTHALPGVEAAAIAGSHPLDQGFTNSFQIVGREAESAGFAEISIRRVTPGYFDTVRLAVHRGRAFAEADSTDAPTVALINEAAASRYFPDQDPIGQRIAFWGDDRRIVGIVANEKIHGLTADTPAAVYTPLAQTPALGSEVLLVRTSSRPDALAASVRSAIHDVDPELAVFGVEPLRQTIGRSVSGQRFTMLLLGAFAAVAIVLAGIGIHGVLSYIVSRRTAELGIRMALGASRGNVIGLVAGQGARLAAFGLAIGLAVALAATRLLGSLLYGVTATDPATFAAVGFGVFAVAMLATVLPARRATGVAPVDALRHA